MGLIEELPEHGYFGKHTLPIYAVNHYLIPPAMSDDISWEICI